MNQIMMNSLVLNRPKFQCCKTIK